MRAFRSARPSISMNITLSIARESGDEPSIPMNQPANLPISELPLSAPKSASALAPAFSRRAWSERRPGAATGSS